MGQDWFESWFDTKYYYTLYKNRDFKEAENFINNLLEFLQPKKEDKFLDIACGKGRHSVFINKKGFEVIGFDLSEQSILEANKSVNDGLSFYTHDMRQIFRTNYFDFGFNLFTSFGYFKSKRDELNALKASAQNLKPNGTLVIDFLNRDKVIDTLVPNETKSIDGIDFKITKAITNNQVVKTIKFQDEDKDFEFQESVKLLGLDDFTAYLKEGGLKITHTFGNYNLEEFNKDSDRLIIIAKKVG